MGLIKYQFNNENGFGDRIVSTALPRDIKNAYVCNDCGYEFVALKTAKCRRCYSRIKAENELKDKADHIAYISNVSKKFDNVLIRMKTNFPLVWNNNPWLDDFDVEDRTVSIGPGMGTQMSNTIHIHTTDIYRVSAENALGITIPAGPPYGDLHLSEAEKSAPPEIDRRYWLITSGGKPQYTSKIWPYDRWQEVVDALPQITFVQIGLSEHFHPPLAGKNVINMVGQTQDHDTGVRRLMMLMLHADGSAGLLSAHMHLAGASPFFKPCVVVAGAREPATFQKYHYHRYLDNGGALICPADETDKRTRGHTNIATACWRQSIEACPRKVKYTYGDKQYYVAKCLDMITVEDVVNAIQTYYIGGRLDPLPEADTGKVLMLKPEIAEVKKEMMQKIQTKLDTLIAQKTDELQALEQKQMMPDTLFQPCHTLGMSDEQLKEHEKLVAQKIKQLPTNEEKEAAEKLSRLLEKARKPSTDLPEPLRLKSTKPPAVKDSGQTITMKRHPVNEETKPAEIMPPELPKDPHTAMQRLWVEKPGSSKVFKMLCNTHFWGGGERSASTIMSMMEKEGYTVHLYPAKYDEHIGEYVIGREFGYFLEEHPDIQVYSTKKRTAGEMSILDPCDVFCLYANDLVYSFNEQRFAVLSSLQAQRKVMVLNYKIGKSPAIIWARQWDKYGFLCNTLRSLFIRQYPEARTFVLPPAVENKALLDKPMPKFQPPLHFVKLASQGDNKHPKETNEMIQQIRQYHPDAKFSFMPAPSFLDTSKEGIYAYQKNEIPIDEFLLKGNIFWYPLPDKYTDQGPRVLIEAMSLGLPAIADNRDGAKERIIHAETGWLCQNHSDYAEILKDVGIKLLQQMGHNAKERARRLWNPHNWVDQILGE